MSQQTKYITSADGWFFVHANDSNSKDIAVFHRIAVWATLENGNTIGLISVLGIGSDGSSNNRLVEPPPLKGTYLHWDDLTEQEREIAIRQSKPPFMKNSN